MRQKSLCNKRFRVVKSYPIGLMGLLVGVWLGGCTPTTPTQQREESSSVTASTPARKDKKVILTTFTVLAAPIQI